MPDGCYERDALAWADHQASLLRRLAGGERLEAAIDWPRVIEEVQDVGLSELRACQSHLVQALTHLLKLHAWPASQATAHWRGETAAFLANARRAFTPSMRQRIDLADLYADARYAVLLQADASGPPAPLAASCPFTLNDLVDSRPDVLALALRLS